MTPTPTDADGSTRVAGAPAPTPRSPRPAGAPARSPSPAQDGAARAGDDAADRPATVPLEAADALPRALQLVGSIVAPTTLVTALFAYFGLLYAIAYYRYFGVNYTVLDLPVQGFLILSASTAVVPLAVFSATVLLALWVYRLPVEALRGEARRFVLVEVLPTVALVGVVLVGAVAADAVLGVRLFSAGMLEARGLSLSAGVVLLAYSARLWHALGPARSATTSRPGAPVALTVAKWMCVTLIFGVGLFWAVGSYAVRMGDQGAQRFAAALGCAPDVVLYSERSLNLAYAGVREEPAPGTEGAYGFRYPGLKLVPQAGDRYLLLLPADWARWTRPPLLLPQSDTVRLEVGPGAC